MAPAYVQSAGGNGSGTSLALAFASDNTAGNLLVAACGASVDPTSVDDSAGNTWQSVGASVTNNGNFVEIFYAMGCAGGPNTVTLHSASGTLALAIAEYSGLALAAALGRSLTGTGFGTAVSTGGMTVTAAEQLLIAASVCENTVGLPMAPGASFTERIEQATVTLTPAAVHLEDRILTAAGSYAGAATLTSSTNWAMQIASFAVPPRTRLYIRETYRPAPFRPGFGR